jgi:hypothetical protein
MPALFEELLGLPASGPPALAFPQSWGRLCREGKVVRFTDRGGSWTGNFEPGRLGGLDVVHACAGGRHVLVIANGDAWIVDLERRDASCLLPAVDWMLDVPDASGWILSRQGLALARVVDFRLVWHTRRLSWDGFQRLRIDGERIRGSAYTWVDDGWHEFTVDLRTGASTGGCYPCEPGDAWELLDVRQH